MSSSWFPYLRLIEAPTECGPTSLCSTKWWGGLQIKKPSPGCAHQAVQHCSPGRFTTYILFYGPFLIHHNTASILLTSPAKHTSLPVPSVFFSLFLSIQHPSPSQSPQPMLLSARTQVQSAIRAHVYRSSTGEHWSKWSHFFQSRHDFIFLLVKCCSPAVPCLHSVSRPS